MISKLEYDKSRKGIKKSSSQNASTQKRHLHKGGTAMYGTIAGNLAGIAYYLYFQFIGLTLIFLFFRRKKPLPKLLIGSVTGSLLLTWLPILFSILFDFTRLSHVLALLVTLPIPIVTFRRYRLHHPLKESIRRFFSSLGQHLLFGILLLFFLIFWVYLLHTHTLLPQEDGAIYTGQCTYGDMNMHLGFITSLAKQGTFPPDYSIMPGVKLSYPFLSDSISASLFMLGASLRLAYILPMIFAMAQIVTTVYLFANTILASRKKTLIFKGSMLTLLLFFCNGGLGFAYFLDWSKEQTYHFSDIFTGFYTTPTNLVDQNIRWVNVIADMFLPQRATLFGYAVLFPALWLLYQAAFQNHREFFPLAGFFVAALPMIHTHSFLSAGIISATWLLLWLLRTVPSRHMDLRSGKTAPENPLQKALRQKLQHPGGWILVGFLGFMCLLQAWTGRGPWHTADSANSANTTGVLGSTGLVLICIALFAIIAGFGVHLLLRHVKQNGWKKLLPGWGIYLACILIFALPQLLFWTFGQVAEGGFVRGYFNWGNQGDPYLWFYLKNIGAPLLLIVGGICACGHKRAPLFLPALLLWWLGELIVFTPNTYDNNKILYVAYLLLCLGAADYGLDLYEKLKSLSGCKLFTAAFLFLTAFSGFLTLGREAVSQYQLYSASQVALAKYVEEHTPADTVFLTNTRHNNEIASLTGRNIVCGADTFLYFHGLNTSERKADLKLMYEAPLEHTDLYEKYQVDYVVISAFERNNYQIKEEVFQNSFTEVFSYGDVKLYQLP